MPHIVQGPRLHMMVLESSTAGSGQQMNMERQW